MICLLLVVSLVSFSFCGEVFETANNRYLEDDFFEMYPKSDWVLGDSAQRSGYLKDFIKHELILLEVDEVGLNNDPSVIKKVYDRSSQALVNKSYEHFVADPLIPESVLDNTRKYIERDVFVSHVLVAHSESRLREKFERTKDEAFLLAKNIKDELSNNLDDFDILANKYSNDPSLSQNGGVVGWLSWGQTIPEFQSVAFDLEINKVSDPVLTDFGYHIVVVTKDRKSEYFGLEKEFLEEVVFEKSRGSVNSLLRREAFLYDSLQVINKGVVFNNLVLESVLGVVNNSVDKGRLVGSQNNYVNVLLNTEDMGVVCVFENRGFGVRWFASRLSRVPSTRRPKVVSVEDLKRVFTIVLLQDFAIKNALHAGLNKTRLFEKQIKSLKYTIYNDIYLKHLVNSVEKPSRPEVVDYYEKHKDDKYMNPEMVEVSEIRSESKVYLDSLYGLYVSGTGFDDVFVLGGEKSRKLGPFARGKYNNLGEFAFSSGVGEVSGVISNLNKTFSFVRVERFLPSSPMGVDKASSRIDALLLKQKQTKIKGSVFEDLYDKYMVVVNQRFFSYNLK